ncbi:acyl-CoA dehydrogenase family protein [Variovorax sp. VNK109]|uniref:acyl-CoA dehydrogenase family protein n=1 Tax=Variovorax sp. VNK109 TaxID=3400919 RepID=UPI003C080550
MSTFINTFQYAEVPEDAEATRNIIRDFLKRELQGMSLERRAQSWMGFDGSFSRKLSANGWVGLTLPKEYGGGGRDAFHRFVLVEELLASGAPVSAHWIAERQSGPLILRFGNDSQKRYFLPRICAAEAFFCIGMSEPDVGSDLASVRTRAKRVDGGWRLNGHKIWTTNAHRCHFMIALVRTSDAGALRHAGLSQFVIDMKTPGVTVRTIPDISGGEHFCEVFLEDVLLSDDALIGQEGAGWEQVNSELAFERSGPERLYSSIVLLEHWLAILRDCSDLSRATPIVGRLAVHLATLRSMSIAVTAQLAKGNSPMIEAAIVKDLGTEFEQFVPSLIESYVGMGPDWSDDFARALHYVAVMAPTFSLRGGTREILRGMISRGLGMR